MRIGIRLAISGLVLASIMVSAIGVHVLWWRTAEANSHALAATINEQIVSLSGAKTLYTTSSGDFLNIGPAAVHCDGDGLTWARFVEFSFLRPARLQGNQHPPMCGCDSNPGWTRPPRSCRPRP